jgi:cytochrome b pre-mRNA-processing protein 3
MEKFRVSLLKRLFAPARDGHAEVRPLWHRIVAIAREPGWYAKGGIADSVAGRFDAITLVLALVLVRMEQDEDLRQRTARLAELFVTDMDGQLRESGVGDVVMGKRMGKLMSVLGGRIDALREALAAADDTALVAAVERNASFGETPDPAAVAAELRALAGQLAALTPDALLAGEIAR